MQWLHARGQRWVPIVDPGIKIDPGYPAYDAGLALGVFITSADDGEPYVGQAGPIALLLRASLCTHAYLHSLVCREVARCRHWHSCVSCICLSCKGWSSAGRC